MKKLCSLIFVAAIVGSAIHASAGSWQQFKGAHLSTETQKLYCIDSRNHFDLRATITEAPYSQAIIRNIDSQQKISVLVRSISTMVYPRRSVEVIQLMKSDDKSHPLSLNLVKSYDCTHRATGKIYPLRALIMEPTAANSELLNLFENSDICCIKK